jgi:hypothetical protein
MLRVRQLAAATHIAVDDTYVYLAIGDPWGLCGTGDGVCGYGSIARTLKLSACPSP